MRSGKARREDDVIVVGGGPAGSASAILFAAQGRRVLLLDAARFPRDKACAEYVSPGGVDILRRLGALDRIVTNYPHRWLRGMQLQAPSSRGRHLIEYQAADGTARSGLAVSRFVLDTALLELARSSGVEVREGFPVRKIWQTDGRVRGVIGSDGEQLAAELVIGADGRHSVVARAVDARRSPLWPRRLGLVAHWSNVEWPEDFGCLLIGQRGYVGVAPLDDQGQVSVGLVRGMPRGRLGPPVAALSAALSEYPELHARLQHGHLEGQVRGVGPLATRVRRSAGPGYRLVGDAAGFFDPFTGEGIYRALRGAELVTVCTDDYDRARERAFSTKQRLVALIQIFVQTPRLMDFAIARLHRRPGVARDLGRVLGDIAPARLDLAWHLLGP